jgi:TolB-like protein
MSLFAELRRRNVFKVAVAYVVVAWLVAQVVSIVAPALRLPEWTITLVVLILLVGLPVALLLAWIYELTPEGVKLTADVPPGAGVKHVTSQRLNYVITGALALVLAVVVVDSYLLDNAADPAALAGPAAAQPQAAGARTPEPASPAAASEASTVDSAIPTAATASGVLANSIAVLPLDNLSPDPNNAYIAAGLHEEILNQLAKLQNLNVIARTSVLQYAENKPPIGEIATALNVESIMEGSVRYAGNRIRVTTQLIDSRTGAHLWSETYDREFNDIFAIESDIAMNVANAVGAEFSLAEQVALETPPTSSPAAYALYLQASDVGRGALLGSTEEALALLDLDIAIDPDFARAYAAKAQHYNSMFVNTVQATAVAVEDRAELERLVRENAERALAIEPDLPTAQLALRGINMLRWQWGNYAESLTPAQERALTTAQLWTLSWLGDHEAALRIARQNAELSPNDSSPRMSLGIVEAYSGDRGASIASLNRSLALAPANTLARAWLAYNAVALGNEAEAIAELEFLERMLGDDPPIVFLPVVAYTYSLIGRGDDAARLFAEIEALPADIDVGVGTWAMAYLAVGDEDEALRQLELAVEKVRNNETDQGYLHLMNMRMNFLADPRLDEPRFAELLSLIRG